MSAVSNPRDESPRMRRRIRVVRYVSLLLAASAIGGLAAVGPTQNQSAQAAVTTPSQLTVKWLGDPSAYQPPRDSASPHYSEFDGIEITVSQTANIIDQAVRVSVTGFAGTKSSTQFGTNAQNFLQAMQCWGPDPLAVDFQETCQWGGRYVPGSNVVGNSVYRDNTRRLAEIDASPYSTTTFDNKFRTVDGNSVSGKEVLINNVTKYPILDLFGPSTTNEVTSARVGADGSGYFDFETQSANQSPQLGCGTTGHLRCWLVVVPRGTVFGGDGDACSSVGSEDPANNYAPYTYGRPNSIQGGSPVNPHCDYWDNRIVVPLDFVPVGATCAVGSTELRVIGSQLMVNAMSSWQPSLCQTVNSTFSFSTNPDAIARAQLLEKGTNTASMAYTGYPVSSGELDTDEERSLLAATKLSYAPVAVSSVVIAFIAEFDTGRQEQLVLSPRLVAKLLTQSYVFTVPRNSSDPAKNVAHLPAVNRQFNFLNQDPEFQALNPTNYNQFTANPSIVLPGPSGADAIRQVWRWILADSKAVAFLNGAPDDYAGMTVNPYYLPKGNAAAVVPWYLDDQKNYTSTPTQRAVGLTNLDGSPQQLSQSVLDTFPKNDESLVPLQLSNERTRFDSIQFAPYTESILTGARQAFRGDPNSKTVWDPAKVNAAGENGDWVSSGIQLPGSKFMMVVTDSPSAALYGLNTASITVANSSVAVSPTAVAMTNALGALMATSLDSVKQVDPAQVGTDGYPMTMVTYAAVNMTKSSAVERSKISDMLKQVTTTGQVPDSGVGGLPRGYLPLPAALVTQATAAANAVKAFSLSTSTTNNGNQVGQDNYSAGFSGDEFGAGAPGADPTLTEDADALLATRTSSASTEFETFTRTSLILALAIGFLGFLIAPVMFRGRGLL